MSEDDEAASEEERQFCGCTGRQKQRQQCKRCALQSVCADIQDSKTCLLKEEKEHGCGKREDMSVLWRRVQAFRGVEVEPSCEEKSESAGEGQHIGDGDEQKTAGAQDALHLLQDCEGVETVFKDFNEQGGGEGVVPEGEGILNVGADGRLWGSFKAVYVNVKADDGVVEAGEFVGEGAFSGAGVQNQARCRKTLRQQTQNCPVCCRVSVASYFTILQVPLFCSASRRRKSGSTSSPFNPIVFI